MSLRSRSSGVTAGNTVSGQDPFGQPADDGRIDFVPVRYHQSLQGIVTQGRDPPGRALRMPVNLPDGVRRKEIPARDVPSLPETERDHRLGVRFVERIDDALEADAVPEVLHLSDPWQELHLPHQDELEELIFVGLIVEERSEERRVGKGVDLGGRRIIKKKKKKNAE